jgi:chromosome segregation ATPase
MSQEQELARLEDFIGKLLEKFGALKEENKRLSSDLEEKEQAIAVLQEQLETKDIEKTEIGDRVSRIIEKIEDWEDDFGTSEESSVVPPNDPSRQGSLFQVASEEVDEIE